jgi:hypothetical protein
MFEAVRKVSGRPVVVDSTKNPVRMRALFVTSDRPLKILYLKRDGRAVTNSRIKRQGVSMARAARAWMSENRKIKFMLRQMPNADVYSIRYEELCRDPAAVMTGIYRFLDLPDASVSLKADRHAVGGNPSRFGTPEIVLDEAWKTDLTPQQLKEYDRTLGGWELT